MISQAIIKADPRLKVLLAVVLGVCTWKVGLIGLAVYLFCLVLLCWSLRSALPGQRHVLKSYGWFLSLWTLAKFGVDIWSGIEAYTAILASLLLALRLSCLLLVGLSLALGTSPRKLGMALTWFLRPVMGKNAWQAALALALMVHFLPITWLTMAEIRQTVGRRCAHLGFFQRMLIIGQSSLRSLGQKTWNQTLAVACRRLDDPQVWNTPLVAGLAQWSGFAFLIFCSVALVYA